MKKWGHKCWILPFVILTVLFHACTKEQQAVPVITSFFPLIATGNDPVRIVGKYFSPATTVSFGGTVAQSFKIISDTVIFAYPGIGASGNVVVTTPAGNGTASGFTFYTPQKFNLNGTCLYELLGYPAIPGHAAIPVSASDTGSTTVMNLNKYDSVRNVFIFSTYPYTMSAYADSADYVRLSGLVSDPGPFFGASYVSFKAGSTAVVYAKIAGTSITIPKQFISLEGSNTVSGTGSLVNGKLTLTYRYEYRGSIKTATLVSN